MYAPFDNSQGGHKKYQKHFCCVTTRSDPHPGKAPRPARVQAGGGLLPAKHVADARPLHVLREPRDVHVVLFVASRPASDAPASGRWDLGNTAGSNAEPRKRGHSLCANRYVGPDAGRWRKSTSREYAGDVPREVLLPTGPPERLAKVPRAFFLIRATRAVLLNLTGMCTPTHAVHSQPKPQAQRKRCQRQT